MNTQEKTVRWLSDFDAALQRGDVAAATQLFNADCYWRDLLSFTWNLKTAEGHDQIRKLLDSTLATYTTQTSKLRHSAAPAAPHTPRQRTVSATRVGELCSTGVTDGGDAEACHAGV